MMIHPGSSFGLIDKKEIFADDFNQNQRMATVVRVSPPFHRSEKLCSCLFSDPIRNPSPTTKECGCEILGQICWRESVENLVLFAARVWPRSAIGMNGPPVAEGQIVEGVGGIGEEG